MIEKRQKRQADEKLWLHCIELRKEVESWPQWKRDAAEAIRRQPADLRAPSQNVK